MIPLHQLVPNPSQPRMANLLDDSLRMSLLETRGLTTPILVERLDGSAALQIDKLKERYSEAPTILSYLDEIRPSYSIVDGERRWCNAVTLIQESPEVSGFLSEVPVDIIMEKLTEKERYVIWVSIHKIRKDWRAMEKENAAYNLIQLTDPKNAANILGVSLPQLQKFIETYQLAQRMRKGARERAISYARETMSLAKYLRPPEVIEAIVSKVNRRLIKDATDIRKLREFLDDPEARKEFIKPDATIESIARAVQPQSVSAMMTLKQNLEAFRQLVDTYGWREVAALKGDLDTTKNIEDTIKVLSDIKQAIA